jgi:hypothetical protein
MDLQITGLRKQGAADEEYVLLEATADCNLADYILCDTTFTSAGKVSNHLRHTYWFPPKAVKRGEFVILRTGTGKNGTFTTTAKQVVHRFFWGLGSAVWNNSGDAAVLLEVSAFAVAKAV